MTATLSVNMIQPGTLYSYDAKTGDELTTSEPSKAGHRGGLR